MPHYHVMNERKDYGRVIDAPSSFEARRIVAAANNADVTDFFAIRKDLMGPHDWYIWNRIDNK